MSRHTEAAHAAHRDESPAAYAKRTDLYVPGTRADPLPSPPPDLTSARAAQREDTRRLRLRRAVEALESLQALPNIGAAGPDHVAAHAGDAARWLRTNRAPTEELRDFLETTILRYSDGSNEARYNAAITARDALGLLWAVS